MPDPHALYVVTAVVVLGLVAWVVIVLSRPVVAQPAALAKASPSPPPERHAKAPPPASPPVELAKVADEGAAFEEDPSVRIGAEVSVELEEDEEPTGPNALILVTAVGRTDPGLKRKHNEDAYAILEDHHLFVIADGMGRHAAGEVASQLCVEAMRDAFTNGEFGPPPDPPLPRRASHLRGSIQLANDRILAAARAKEEYAGMGTTVVAAYFSPNKQRVYIAHVGDSRCYRLRGGKLTQLTTDHTLGAAGITGKSAAVLSRAVGIEANVEIDINTESPLPGDVYLLCSDGLSRMVPHETILSILESAKDLDSANRVLIDKANQSGGRDNITCILVRVDDAKI
jgi:protein phosphatase